MIYINNPSLVQSWKESLLSPCLINSFSFWPELVWANATPSGLPSFPSGFPSQPHRACHPLASGVLLASANKSLLSFGTTVSTGSLRTWLLFKFLSVAVSLHSRGCQQPLPPWPLLSKAWVCSCLSRCNWGKMCHVSFHPDFNGDRSWRGREGWRLAPPFIHLGGQGRTMSFSSISVVTGSFLPSGSTENYCCFEQ